MNYFLAITGKNLQEEFNKVTFESKDGVLNLYPPNQNKNPNPHFKSIMEGFRELDRNPEEAVIFIFEVILLGYVPLKKGQSNSKFLTLLSQRQ